MQLAKVVERKICCVPSDLRPIPGAISVTTGDESSFSKGVRRTKNVFYVTPEGALFQIREDAVETS